ncbi:ATP-binding protein, partial [Rhodococcus erythropolis]|nr:ATP-binding protein [Rhodococcus erythropolis]
HHAISTTGVECEVRVHGTPVSYTDARRLERIIANLILNARNHGKPPINVDVDHSRITVRDRGSGFTEEWLRQGPKRFQTDCVERGPNSGLGLGLTIVVGQAAVIGARINFSNHPNGGAVVTIDLPECPPDEFA